MIRLKIPQDVQMNLLFWRGAKDPDAQSINKAQNVTGTGFFTDYVMYPCFANQSSVSFGLRNGSDDRNSSLFDFEVEAFMTGCLYYNEKTSVWSTDGCWVSF